MEKLDGLALDLEISRCGTRRKWMAHLVEPAPSFFLQGLLYAIGHARIERRLARRGNRLGLQTLRTKKKKKKRKIRTRQANTPSVRNLDTDERETETHDFDGIERLAGENLDDAAHSARDTILDGAGKAFVGGYIGHGIVLWERENAKPRFKATFSRARSDLRA